MLKKHDIKNSLIRKKNKKLNRDERKKIRCYLAPEVQKDFLSPMEQQEFDQTPYRVDLLEVFQVHDL